MTAPIRLRVLGVPRGSRRLASSATRLHQYVTPLRRLGIECQVIEPGFIARRVPALYRRRVWSAVREMDVVLLQKVLWPEKAVDRLREAPTKLVFDFDDAIYTTPVGVQLSAEQLATRRARLEHLLRSCDLVIAGNRHLAEYAARFAPRVTVIPTPVDCERFRPVGRKPETPGGRPAVIGWVGSTLNQTHHLALLKQPLELVGRSHSIIFRIVGARSTPELVRLFRSSSYELEFLPYTTETLPVLVSQLDIGVMPLTDDEYSRGKCALKALLYMAAGVPTVCSPVGMNREVITHGANGFLASDAESWAACLQHLIEKPDLRDRLAVEGRHAVEDRYSLEITTRQLFEALTGLPALSGAGR